MTTNETIKEQVKHQMRIIRQGAANLVAQGGVRKNGVPVISMEETIENGDVFRIGKKKFVKLIIDI